MLSHNYAVDRAAVRKRLIAPGAPPVPQPPPALIRGILLVALVFTLAVLTGGYLSGAPRAASDVDEPPDQDHPAAGPVRGRTDLQTASSADPTFAQSMIISGGVGLLVSCAGTVMVLRRRRLW